MKTWATLEKLRVEIELRHENFEEHDETIFLYHLFCIFIHGHLYCAIPGEISHNFCAKLCQ